MVNQQSTPDRCRSREGAWIEMIAGAIGGAFSKCRSREGAWIEINYG